MPRLVSMFGRALRLRCPNCGKGKPFVSWFRMRSQCEVCGLAFERGEDGYQVGSYMFNIVASELVFAAVFLAIVLLTWPSPPWALLQYGGVALVATLVLLGAVRDARTPLVAAPRRAAGLPPALERAVVEALVTMPAGIARRLLADVVRTCGALFDTIAREGDPRGLAPSLGELVTAACRAARDLADLDDQLTRFERQRERLAAASPERLDALARCERTRDALVQRLLEAMTAVSRLRTSQAELSDAGESTLGDVTRELREEADLQAAAAREIAVLLGS
jgi:uncharacterized protein (DUF983 family)